MTIGGQNTCFCVFTWRGNCNKLEVSSGGGDEASPLFVCDSLRPANSVSEWHAAELGQLSSSKVSLHTNNIFIRVDETSMNSEATIFFVNQLRDARGSALRDAEAFQEILFVLERLGFAETRGKVNGTPGLGTYKVALGRIASESPLYLDIPRSHSIWHSPFSELYDSVKDARNDALHQGAFARHLTNHAIQLALILEDALMSGLSRVSEYMVREPACASLWHPISFVRQQMLANSFSYLPVLLTTEGRQTWHLISDYAVAKYLRTAESNTQRNSFLAKTMEESIASRLLETERAEYARADANVKDVIRIFKGKPLLVLDEHSHLVGILTSFDLL